MPLKRQMVLGSNPLQAKNAAAGGAQLPHMLFCCCRCCSCQGGQSGCPDSHGPAAVPLLLIVLHWVKYFFCKMHKQR